MRRGIAFLLLVMCLTTGCGRFASKDASRDTRPPDTASVGAGIDEATGATTTTAPGSARSGPSTIVVAAAPTTLPANVSEVDSPEGFRLTLTVEGDLRYGPGEDIKVQVEALNISGKPLQYDPNDLRNFAIRPPGSATVAWSDGNCRAARVPKAVETRAQVLNPNEQTRFADTYPGPTDAANRDGCRIANGSYVVYGFVTWCPAGTTDARGVCDPARSRQIASRGVRITIG